METPEDLAAVELERRIRAHRSAVLARAGKDRPVVAEISPADSSVAAAVEHPALVYQLHQEPLELVEQGSLHPLLVQRLHMELEAMVEQLVFQPPAAERPIPATVARAGGILAGLVDRVLS